MSNVDLRKYVEKAMTYGEYVALMDELLAKGMATGADQSEDHVNYTKLNRQRMSRIDKTVSVNDIILIIIIVNNTIMTDNRQLVFCEIQAERHFF